MQSCCHFIGIRNISDRRFVHKLSGFITVVEANIEKKGKLQFNEHKSYICYLLVQKHLNCFELSIEIIFIIKYKESDIFVEIRILSKRLNNVAIIYTLIP